MLHRLPLQEAPTVASLIETVKRLEKMREAGGDGGGDRKMRAR